MSDDVSKADATAVAFERMLQAAAKGLTDFELPAPVVEFAAQMQRVAGYNLANVAIFERAREWLIAEPRPPRLQLLSEKRGSFPGERGRSRYDSLKGALWPYGDVCAGLARMQYHRDNLARIEQEIRRAATETGAVELFREGRSALGGGNTLVLDFEYQAFIVSARSCLDYLTRAVAGYFADDSHSFHTLPKRLRGYNPRLAATRVLEAVEPRHAALSAFYSDGESSRSVRDRITHREFVRAGCVNITPIGLVLANPAEGTVGSTEESLLPVLDQHVVRVNDVVNCTVAALIDADRVS